MVAKLNKANMQKNKSRYKPLYKKSKDITTKKTRSKYFKIRGATKVRRNKYKNKTKNFIRKADTVKQPALPLNLDFYSVAEGVYTSYWTGKLINVLLTEGKKKTAAKHVYRAFAILKFSQKVTPLLLLLETLDKIKPTFRLRNYIVRRVIIKEYPIVVLRPRQLILSIHWLKDEIRSNPSNFFSSLSVVIASKLIDFSLSPKKNNLIKKRTEYIRRTIKAQFNVRYNFR